MLAAVTLAAVLMSADAPADYAEARAKAGRTPEAQVRLALWCEAHGMPAERLKHLAMAVMADPANAAARGLMGLVEQGGRWQRPEDVARAIQSDPERLATLAEYDARRQKTPYKADAQYDLGLWCEDHGLRDQARSHLTAAVRLDPSKESAWKRLGYRKHEGRWVTDSQLAAEKEESESQKRADRHWKPLLEKWKGMLGQPSKREGANEALLGVTDPRAVRSIWSVFGGGASNQPVAVQLLGQIEGEAASRALAELAITGVSPAVRRASTETLARRDPREFIGLMVKLVRAPLKYEVRPVAGPGTVGVLFVEGERYNVRRIYDPRPLAAPYIPPRLFGDDVPFDPLGRQAGPFAGLRGGGASQFTSQPAPGSANRPGSNLVAEAARRDAQIGQILLAAQADIQMAQQVLAADIRSVEATNNSILAGNERVLPVLKDLTGQDLGADPEAWRKWDTDRAGYAFQSAPTEKPTYTQFLAVTDASVRPHHACFAAGTPVRTIDGPRPIETIRSGDLVLVQDTKSGGLSYQPVVTPFHNPPSGTFRVHLGDEDVVATGIHRFWKAGHGWAMARDLKPGDTLRTLGGVAVVSSVEADETQPVFNLEVAEGHDFFVGKAGTLVHDNSLVEAVTAPFDSPNP